MTHDRSSVSGRSVGPLLVRRRRGSRPVGEDQRAGTRSLALHQLQGIVGLPSVKRFFPLPTTTGWIIRRAQRSRVHAFGRRRPRTWSA
jgi:hypothetical protein